MYRWQDLIFDVLEPKDRADYLKRPGAVLPITHEGAPLEHASLCEMLRAGEYGSDLISWNVRARVDLSPGEMMPDESGESHCKIDFSTLAATHDAMLLAVDAHAAETSRPKTDRPSKPPPSKPKASKKTTRRR